MALDSENWLFNKITSDDSSAFPYPIDRTRYNRRKRQLFRVLENIRQKSANPGIQENQKKSGDTFLPTL